MSTPLLPSALLRRTRGQARRACALPAALSGADVLACVCEELASTLPLSALVAACAPLS